MFRKPAHWELKWAEGQEPSPSAAKYAPGKRQTVRSRCLCMLLSPAEVFNCAFRFDLQFWIASLREAWKDARCVVVAQNLGVPYREAYFLHQEIFEKGCATMLTRGCCKQRTLSRKGMLKRPRNRWARLAMAGTHLDALATAGAFSQGGSVIVLSTADPEVAARAAIAFEDQQKKVTSFAQVPPC